jgi:hypothetical protein
MKWLSNGGYLKEWQLNPYLEHYHSQRLSSTLDDFHPIKYNDKPLEPIPRLPFFDKVAGCMSLLIDATAALIDHYQWERNLQKIIEITTPIGWAHGFINYLKVMKKWRWSGLLLKTGDTIATSLWHMSWNAYRCLVVSTWGSFNK